MKIFDRTVSALLCAFALVACNVVSENEMTLADELIINSPEGAESGVLLVHLSKGQDPASLPGETRPVFTANAKNVSVLAAEGLDRWFELAFDPSIEVSDMARQIADSGIADLIEYSKAPEVEPVTKAQPADLTPAVRTKTDAAAFDDPYLYLQWNYINDGNQSRIPGSVAGADISVQDAWRLCAGDNSIIVAVIDEGVNYLHPDLAANMWKNEAEVNGKIGTDDDGNGYVDDKYGYNFVKEVATISWNNSGDEGHATHVSGTIAAVNGNGVGVCGIAGGTGNGDGVRIMSLQIVMGSQSASSANRARAYQYAADNGAVILQCSFGLNSGVVTSDSAFDSAYGVEADALRYFAAHAGNDVIDGGIMVFSSGNEGSNMAGYPGAMTECISVTALAADGLPAYYTNYGVGCNIAAPGGEYYTHKSNQSGTTYSAILSTVPKDLWGTEYAYMQGTSMACPHVSGVAALGLSYARKLGKHYTASEYAAMVLTATDALDYKLSGTRDYLGTSYALSQYKNKMGTGSIDAWRLMMEVEGTPWLLAASEGKQSLSLVDFFGANASNMTFLSVTISDEDRKAIGLLSDPKITKGELVIEPSKPGAAKMTISAIAGGSIVGGGNKAGGTMISKDVSVIVKSAVGKNGGWL